MMKDNEIIKANELCNSFSNDCKECPYYGYHDRRCRCTDYLTKDTVNLISRQKAEIEKIKKDLKHYLDTNEENGVVYLPKFIVKKMVGDV